MTTTALSPERRAVRPRGSDKAGAVGRSCSGRGSKCGSGERTIADIVGGRQSRFHINRPFEMLRAPERSPKKGVELGKWPCRRVIHTPRVSIRPTQQIERGEAFDDAMRAM